MDYSASNSKVKLYLPAIPPTIDSCFSILGCRYSSWGSLFRCKRLQSGCWCWSCVWMCAAAAAAAAAVAAGIAKPAGLATWAGCGGGLPAGVVALAAPGNTGAVVQLPALYCSCRPNSRASLSSWACCLLNATCRTFLRQFTKCNYAKYT